MRDWPCESMRAKTCCARAIVASSTRLISDSASRQASSSVSRTMTCRRMPKRISRPSASASRRTEAIFSATWSGGSPQVR